MIHVCKYTFVLQGKMEKKLFLELIAFTLKVKKINKIQCVINTVSCVNVFKLSDYKISYLALYPSAYNSVWESYNIKPRSRKKSI